MDPDALMARSGSRRPGHAHQVTSQALSTWLDARYIDSREPSVQDKQVELVPGLLLRTGFQWRRGPFRLAWQTAYTGKQYTEATNAESTPDGINGSGRGQDPWQDISRICRF